ncbi:hypothetical protein [Vagococcus fluvialis]|uniref:hypothetical protein n=1 Tax=Vagococcus fluvialis TaxID=2738 RepID=UPI00143300B4|nr:hypothetical protein [Vagococcus fluvialis]MBO0487977.1 hypothetical protein [Vagococcus fluvialis]MCM2137945.1 hypothetical protein [Vagococcus fluvialis]MDT2745533.1 hypothetical protein [Vagococcus fluvialis]MDT2782560.1 hypothetical protein [Vagococcus fluvialis]NKC60842.1 hypothetical protein [Vagococcus fluvialis]
MSNYTLSDYEAAKKSLSSTLRKIEKAIVSLEEKQAEGKNLKAQIILSKERVKALSISLDLIEKEIINLTKI